MASRSHRDAAFACFYTTSAETGRISDRPLPIQSEEESIYEHSAVTAVIAWNRPDQFHLAKAMENGVTKDEVIEVSADPAVLFRPAKLNDRRHYCEGNVSRI